MILIIPKGLPLCMPAENDDGMRFQLPTDLLVLEALAEGRNVGANIAKDVDKHRKTVNPRLRQLEDYGLVRNIGNGVYELTDAGRDAIETLDENTNNGGRPMGGRDIGEIVEQQLAERDDDGS